VAVEVTFRSRSTPPCNLSDYAPIGTTSARGLPDAIPSSEPLGRSCYGGIVELR
jgi:hypothetical protein